MKNVNTKFGLIVAAMFGLVAESYAQVPTGVQEAFQQASTDTVTVVGYIATALVAFVAALWVIKAIRSGR